ncbi:MAG: hypothetical protein U1D55_17750 [Phycisphaerae bacterium]
MHARDRAIRALAVVLLLSAGVNAAQARGGELPDALEHVFQYRALLETAEIEFTYSNVKNLGGTDIHFRERLAGPDVAIENLGDDRGWVLGSAAQAGKPHVLLATPDGTYSHESTFTWMTMSARDETRHENPLQLRSLGIVPSLPYDDVGVALERGSEARALRERRFEEVREGKQVQVREHLPTGVITWSLDPDRDWSPTRVTYERDGRVQQEARITLDRFDNLWFPKVVEFFRANYRDGTQPAAVIKVTKAEFLRPEHPKRLTPADVGIEPGMEVSRPGVGPGGEVHVWDGARAIPLSEWSRLERRGLVDRGPRNRAALDALPMEIGQTGPPRIPRADLEPSASNRVPLIGRAPGLWEQYTREFIADFQLDAEQTQRAWRILRECQDSAKRHLKAKADEIEQASDALNALPAEDRGGERGAPARVRLWKLVEPVNRIFVERLKPGLDRLPTRSQRAAAEAATTQSTKP